MPLATDSGKEGVDETVLILRKLDIPIAMSDDSARRSYAFILHLLVPIPNLRHNPLIFSMLLFFLFHSNERA